MGGSVFSIEKSASVGVNGDKEWVIDSGRDMWLQRVSQYAMVPVRAFQFHVGPRVFLVETERGQLEDGTYRASIVNLGYSPVATRETGIVSDRFESDEDRHRVGLLACEALLVYGSFYNGNPDPAENNDSILFDGRVYSLVDF